MSTCESVCETAAPCPTQETHSIADVQSYPDSRKIAIDKVGIKAIRHPVKLLDKSGGVLEAFTPDFYLQEFDLYVELTTMKQSLVTRKNRKVRLLRELYPHLNIQVFYQKDFENLIFKYGLAAREVPA